MKNVILVSLLVITFPCFAQTGILGTWQIIKYEDNGIIYNLEKDKLIVPQKLRSVKEAFKKNISDEFGSMILKFQDSTLEIFKNNKLMLTRGVSQMVDTDHTILGDYRSEDNYEFFMPYSLKKDDELWLYYPVGKARWVNLTLKRIMP